MGRWRSKRWLGVALGGTIALSAALFACGQYQVWSWSDYKQYRTISTDYSIGRDLWFGQIAPGEDVEVLISWSDPDRVLRYGRWVQLTYAPGGPRPERGLLFESVTVLAKDGQLVLAGAYSCTWQRVFFDALSTDDRADQEQAFREYTESQLQK